MLMDDLGKICDGLGVVVLIVVGKVPAGARLGVFDVTNLGFLPGLLHLSRGHSPNDVKTRKCKSRRANDRNKHHGSSHCKALSYPYGIE